LIIGQRSADAVAYGSGLTRQPAAFDRAPDIELAEPVRRDERLIDDHPQYRPRKINWAFAAVDVDFAGAGLDPHAGNGVLALAGGIGAAERVASRFYIHRHRGRNRRRGGRRTRLLHRLTQASQTLKCLSAGALRWIVIGHRY